MTESIPEKKLKTRDRILDTALRLFNEGGASRVSAKKIAKEMEISPGNLHYHFRTKNEIIRTLWEMLVEKLSVVWTDPEIHYSEEAIARFFSELSTIFYEFRFFYLELPVLLDRDPELKLSYAVRSKKILATLRVFSDSWTSAGIMLKQSSERDRKTLIRNMYLVSQVWMNYWHTIYSDMNVENVRQGMMQILSLYKPYFNEKSARKIESLIMKH